MRDFNMKYYSLAAAIFQHAERMACPEMRQETSSCAYTKERQAEALRTCTAENLPWIPVFETYKGKRSDRKGHATVRVEMPDGTSYGFLFPGALAQEVYRELELTWRDYHGIQEK